MNIKLGILCMMLSSTAFSSEAIGIKVDFEHNAKVDSWKVSRDVVATDSVG